MSSTLLLTVNPVSTVFNPAPGDRPAQAGNPVMYYHQQKRILHLIRRRCVLTQATYFLRPMHPIRPDLERGGFGNDLIALEVFNQSCTLMKIFSKAFLHSNKSLTIERKRCGVDTNRFSISNRFTTERLSLLPSQPNRLLRDP